MGPMKFSYLVLLSFLSVVLYGADEMQMRSLENRVTRLEKNQVKLEESSHVAKEGFDIERDVALGIEVLWWGIREDGLGYAIEGVKSDLVNIPKNIEYSNWNWDVGVRAAAHFNLGYDDWEAGTEYTYFSSKSSDQKDVGRLSLTTGAPVLLTTWSAILGTDVASYAKIQYNFNLNNIDFDLSRGFWLSPAVVLRPVFGLRGALLDSSAKVTYITKYVIGATHYDDTVNLTQHTKGIGPKGELNSEWYVNRIFNIYFNLGFALLWADYSMSQHEVFKDVVAGTEDSMRYKNKYLSTLPVIDMALGVRAGCWFWDNKAHVEFNVGWDQHLWLNYNRMQKTVNQNPTQSFNGLYAESSGHLMLSGLTAGVRLDF